MSVCTPWDLSSGLVPLLPGQVVELLKPPTDRTGQSKHQVLLGRPVCPNAFRRLLGIGAGRYARLKRTATTGSAVPLDGRCLKKKILAKNKESVRKRSLIVSFLTDLYHTLSEPMPEANQSLKASCSDDALDSEGVPRKMRFRRNRGRRPRAAGLLHRGKDQSEMRMLPPGSFSDYLTLLRARHPDETVSLKLFSKASCRMASIYTKFNVCLNSFTVFKYIYIYHKVII